MRSNGDDGREHQSLRRRSRPGDGHSQFIGSDGDRAIAEIRRAAAEPKLPISLRAMGGPT
jgi:hypothetical protein